MKTILIYQKEAGPRCLANMQETLMIWVRNGSASMKLWEIMGNYRECECLLAKVDSTKTKGFCGGTAAVSKTKTTFFGEAILTLKAKF